MTSSRQKKPPRRSLLVLHGPNLNLLGRREPAIYGTTTLAEINRDLARTAATVGYTVRARQSNHEGDLIDWVQQAPGNSVGVLLNPGGLTHTSVALRDAIAAIDLPVVEVHLSNPDAREEFRRTSLIAPVCLGRVCGFGAASYRGALLLLVDHLSQLNLPTA